MQQPPGQLDTSSHLTRDSAEAKPLQHRRSRLRTTLTIITTIVLSALISYAILSFTIPQPTLTVQSDYHRTGLAAGSSGTIFYLNGHHFAANTPITLLLDGHLLKDAPAVRSTGEGSFRAELTVTANWGSGMHQISVQRHANSDKINPVQVIIVQPGEAHTPGPANAPANDSTFELVVTFQGRIEGKAPFTWQQEFDIHGRPDPQGGSICTDDDTGTLQKISSTKNEIHTRAMRCQGHYISGQLTYDEIIVADQVKRLKGTQTIQCTIPPDTTYLHLSGAFSNKTVASGTFEFPAIQGSCSDKQQHYSLPQIKGTWSGHFPDDD